MMAGWRGGDRIGRQMLLFKVPVKITLVFLAFSISVATTTYAQPGFLSIDCGYAGPNYTDPSTNLTWTGDSGSYMNVGESYGQSANAVNQWLQTFRFFPEPSRNKYCYELPTVMNTSYLIRASFYLNETVLKERRPFQFTLYLDATNWFTLTSGDDSIADLLVGEEVIFQPPNNITNFCIRPVTGVPFISSLELRELPNTMYNYSGNNGEYLALLLRYNLATNTTPSVRFPDDKFDRIWQPASVNTTNVLGEIPVSIANPPDNQTGADTNFVPPKVLQDGWVLNYTSASFTLYSRYLPVYMIPSQYAFAVIYAEPTNSTDVKLYNVTIVILGEQEDNQGVLRGDSQLEGTFSDRAAVLKFPQVYLWSNALNLIVTSPKNDILAINAIEVYGRYMYNYSVTDISNVRGIAVLKTSLNLEDWQGDPCAPVPDDFLSCMSIESGQANDYVLDYPEYNPVEKPCSLNGASTTYCVDDQAFLSYWDSFLVSTMNFHDLSNANTRLLDFGRNLITTGYAYVSALTGLSITQSNVTSETLQNFILDTELGSVIAMDWSYNAIDNVNSSAWVIFSQYSLQSLNLSHNQIYGVMDTFSGFTLLKTLDLSFNKLTSLPAIWINSTTILNFLDLSHNQLQGQISSLDLILQVNNASLQELNISNNNFEGLFSSSLFFSGLHKLTFGIFDQNHIQGTLDLSIWYTSLQKATNFQDASLNINVISQLFSFVNNDISDISPNAETIMPVLDMVMEKYNSTSFGILLGGNPYCDSAESYAQKYLCRYSIYATIPEISNKKSHNYREIILIIVICGGIIAFLVTSITSAAVWKLRKQVYSLRAIQQALAQRKVQPPFYQYNALKLATKDFHNDYKLGEGGFGIVYKGVLEDGKVLAVKKLSTSKEAHAQNDLQEFLNEVVLITGIKHRNLVHLKGCCIKDKQRMLVYEYAEHGNLAEALYGSKAHGSLDWGQRYNICVGVARGLSYLHDELQPSIIHRDIKPANILLDENFRPKIADFGTARHSSNETSVAHYTKNVAGTLGYFAPEYASEGQLTDKADVYSYGIVVLEVICGRKCIDLSLPAEKAYLKNWVKKVCKEGMMLDVLQDELRDHCVVDEVIKALKIALLCVQSSPRNRPSMFEVVTMFFGSGDVLEVVHEADNSHQNLQDILEII